MLHVYAIDSLLADDMQTIFGIIVMPAMVMSLLSQFIIHPFLVRIRDYLATKDYSNLKKIVDKLLGVTFVLGCIVILCAYIMGIPVLNILYGLDLTSYKIPFYDNYGRIVMLCLLDFDIQPLNSYARNF